MDNEEIRICTECGEYIEVLSGDMYETFNGKCFCLNCALKRGILGPLSWLDYHGIDIYHHAEYHDGKITAYQKWGRGYRKDELAIHGH